MTRDNIIPFPAPAGRLIFQIGGQMWAVDLDYRVIELSSAPASLVRPRDKIDRSEE